MTFREDPRFESALFAGSEMDTVLLETASDIADLAGTIANEDTGHYKRSLQAERVGPGRARALTTDIAGHLIEFGSEKNTAMAPLRRAADVIADGFREEPK